MDKKATLENLYERFFNLAMNILQNDEKTASAVTNDTINKIKKNFNKLPSQKNFFIWAQEIFDEKIFEQGLLQSAIDGSKEAENRLFIILNRKLNAAAIGKSFRQNFDVNEVVQKTLIRIYREYKTMKPLLPLAYKKLKDQIYDDQRKSNRRKQFFNLVSGNELDQSKPGDNTKQDELTHAILLREHLLNRVKKLNENEKAVLRIFLSDGDRQDLIKMLKKKQGTIDTWISRLREKLRSELLNEENTENYYEKKMH